MILEFNMRISLTIRLTKARRNHSASMPTAEVLSYLRMKFWSCRRSGVLRQSAPVEVHRNGGNLDVTQVLLGDRYRSLRSM